MVVVSSGEPGAEDVAGAEDTGADDAGVEETGGGW